jgi:cytochrome P450
MSAAFPGIEQSTPIHDCPAQDQRKVSPKVAYPAQAIEIDEKGMWHIHGYDEARQILRSELVKQAGFHVEEVMSGVRGLLKNPPILYLDGEEHTRMRRETNKFFTPAITDKQYRDFMHAFADDLIGKLKEKKRANLNDLTMEMAMKVAAQVVGLTNSATPGLNKRLLGLLNTSTNMLREPGVKPNMLQVMYSQRWMLAFLLLDVKPAIRARRKNPQNDVISYLITRGYTDLEILTECIVYGVAGMITTREFICVAALHLMDSPHLRRRMVVGSQEERYAILHEILRLEPIVGRLHRRTAEALTIQSGGQDVTIPAGTLVELNIFASNLDAGVVGENATAVCPARTPESTLGKVGDAVMSFGDGAHRCPGAFIAIQESDIFLQKLLGIETLRIEREPELVFNRTVQGYEVHDLPIVVD